MSLRRILRIMIKEFTQTLRDKKMIGILFVAPVLQLFLFGYAVTTDINHVSFAVYDEDRTRESREVIDRLIASGTFEYTAWLQSPRDINDVLDDGNARIVLHIPRDFARQLARGQATQLQLLLDGSDSMSARIIAGYATAVLQQYTGAIIITRLDRLRGSQSDLSGVEARLRVWYNPEMKSVNFMVPGVLCLVLLITTLVLTALAIVKEKEIGTLEQLIVTPVTPAELMLGKTLPFLIVGFIDMLLVLAIAVWWFHVPIAGSLLLLLVLSITFLMTTLGLGIFISTISQTQHEAILTSFFFFMPFILLSGFIFPIANMPPVIRAITYVIPLRYFLEIIRGIFLKGIGLELLWPQALTLILFGIAIITISALRFHKRLG